MLQKCPSYNEANKKIGRLLLGDAIKSELKGRCEQNKTESTAEHSPIGLGAEWSYS